MRMDVKEWLVLLIFIIPMTVIMVMLIVLSVCYER